jgi:Protein of unknown function (DUF3574)
MRSAAMTRLSVLALIAALAMPLPAGAVNCAGLRGEPAILVQLFFGRSVKGRAPVTDAEWQGFVRRTLMPAFPEGFTVTDARGQWLNPEAKRVSVEQTKLVLISTPQTPETIEKVERVVAEWKRRFRQLSVGSVLTESCSAF